MEYSSGRLTLSIGRDVTVENIVHKAIDFSLKKLGKPKVELRREQYDAIRAICFERKDALAVLPTGFRKSLIYREFLTTFEAAVSLSVIILLWLLCHPEAH